MFTLDELNLDTAAAMTLMLAATGQTIVLLRGGIDLSIGGMISLGTVIAATRSATTLAAPRSGRSPSSPSASAVGVVNGADDLDAQAAALPGDAGDLVDPLGRGAPDPADRRRQPARLAGSASASLRSSACRARCGSSSLLVVFWLWFRARASASPSGRPARTSSRPSCPASRSPCINVATYGLSGLFAALAALYLTTQTGAGSPTIGKDYILPSVAAAVIGGISLFGGRGHLLGTLIGAFILTIIGNLVFVLSISSYWQPVVSGVILLVSVLASSIAEKSARRSLT